MQTIYAAKGKSMYATKHHGFAMILAIFIIVLVAGAGALLMHNAAKGSKTVSDNYLRAQASLLADSATEFAVMRAQGFDTSGGNCLNELDINATDSTQNSMFDVNVTLSYSFRNAHPSGAGTCLFLEENTSKDTTILVDTTVTDHNLSTEPIRIHKRTWQKL